MGRKKNLSLNEQFAIQWLNNAPTLDKEIYRLSQVVSIAAVTFFTIFFVGSLNLMDKIFAFIISGKLMGTSYVLDFNDICILSATVVSGLLARSVYSYLKIANNRNKIKLQIKEAAPFTLTVRINA